MHYQWLTPADPAAIAVVRVPPWAQLLDREPPALGHARFACLCAADASVVDEVVVSACAETYWELACHGGLGMRQAVSAALVSHGLSAGVVAAAEAEEWQHLAGIIHPAALATYLRQGADCCHQPWWNYRNRPLRIVLTGPSNAGKSTLLNAWCGQQRALAGPQPGTTRDLLRAGVQIGGWCCELVDSAGLRETADGVERAGQDLLQEARAAADAVIFCSPADGADSSVAVPQSSDLCLLTKADLVDPAPPGLHWFSPQHGSAVRSEALLQHLQQAIIDHLGLPTTAEINR